MIPQFAFSTRQDAARKLNAAAPSLRLVGPVWHDGDRDEHALLASCYSRSLELAGGAGLTSIAFPAISTGVYGFPRERAAKIAIATVTDEAPRYPSLQRVIFCCFSERDAAIYRATLRSDAR